jgi:hypothetical protein
MRVEQSEATEREVDAPQRTGWRYLAIVFALGLVLGLVVASTLAVSSDSGRVPSERRWWNPGDWTWAWNDFEAADWNVQGNFAFDSADTGWSDFAAASQEGEFEFSMNPAGLMPGDTMYAPVSLRIDPERNGYAADVTLRGGVVDAPNALFDALRYRVGDATAADCTAGRLGNPRDGFPGAEGEPVPLFSSSDSLKPVQLPTDSSPAYFCFGLTLPAEPATDLLLQDLRIGPVTWKFVAQAVD